MIALLDALALADEIKFYGRDKATMPAPSALSAVHALGKSPVALARRGPHGLLS